MDVKTYCDEWRESNEPDDATLATDMKQRKLINNILKGSLDAVLRSLLLCVDRPGESPIRAKHVWQGMRFLNNENNTNRALFYRQVLNNQLSEQIIYRADLNESEHSSTNNPKKLYCDDLIVDMGSLEITDSFSLIEDSSVEVIVNLLHHSFGPGVFIAQDIDSALEKRLQIDGRWRSGFRTERKTVVFADGATEGYSYLLYVFMMLNSSFLDEDLLYDYIAGKGLDNLITVNKEELIYAILTRRAIIFDDPISRVRSANINRKL